MVSLFVWAIIFDLSGLGDPANSYATAGLALRIIWPHKPHNYVKIDTPSWSVQYSILILFLFLAKSSADMLRGDASPSSYQENSQAATLERLKDSIQEFLSKQDAMSKIQVFWPQFFIDLFQRHVMSMRFGSSHGSDRKDSLFWHVMLHNIVSSNQCYGFTCCFQVKNKYPMVEAVSSKCR